MVFVAGLVGIIIFYLAILGVGIWASRKAKNNSEEELMLAGRSVGFVVGTLTLVATWVGGGYINGASEVMFLHGLAWAQVPIGYSIALLVGALLFVKPMRDLNCITLLDPFQRKYGNTIGAFLFIPSVFGDLFWVGSILNALGSSLVVITDLQPITSVIISVIFVASYTSVGAMYSVTYTDVVQMFFILFGLILSVPFVATNPHLDAEKLKTINWVGTIPDRDVGEWVDTMLLLIFGGIPWQGYMQRILSIKNTKTAQYLSMISMAGCAVMSIPSSYIGVVAGAVNWDQVSTFNRNITSSDASNILPLVLRHLTPAAVAFFGLGAISAAVMSSADSSVLSFSAMFSRNLYKNLIRRKAKDKEIVWVLRITVVCISILSAVIALTVSSIYYLSVLSSDLIYVILFPQLLLVIHWNKFVNSYGCVASYIIGALLRILSGEHALGIPAVIKYPNYDEVQKKQKFPHRTMAMLCALATHVLVSWSSEKLFKKKIIPLKYDFFRCFGEAKENVPLTSVQDGTGKGKDFQVNGKETDLQIREDKSKPSKPTRQNAENGTTTERGKTQPEEDEADVRSRNADDQPDARNDQETEPNKSEDNETESGRREEDDPENETQGGEPRKGKDSPDESGVR